MESVAKILEDMAQSIGTTRYIRHFSGLAVFTEGVDLLRQNADCFWLVDTIASYQKKYKDVSFQVWNLKVDTENKTAVLTMKEDSGCPNLVKEKIDYTDFPLPSVDLWVETGYIDYKQTQVLELPSEH